MQAISTACIGLFLACNAPKTAPNQAPQLLQKKNVVESPWITQSQIDSFRILNGQSIPPSLWASLHEDSIPHKEVFFLTGNLDQDPAREVILWYPWELTGMAIWLDKRGDHWEKLGIIQLNFFHGDTPPRIDAETGMFICYDFGWGSGYGSDIMNFYQVQADSLVCVFRVLESESLYMMGSGAIRIISTKYQFVRPDQILVTYHYKVNASQDGRYRGRTIFERKLMIPAFWDGPQNCFVPKLPPGMEQTLPEQIFIEDGETTFDPFFEPELEKLKWKGPRWKRRALGNPLED